MSNKNKSLLKIICKILISIVLIVVFYASAILIYKNISSALATNILEYIKVLVWPILILLVIFTFQPNIAHLIERMDEWDIPFVGKGKTHESLTQQNEIIKTDIVVSQNESSDFKKIIEIKEAEITALQDNSQQLIEKLTRAQIELDFERIYNIIFASQIDLLFNISNFHQVEFSYVTDHYTKTQQAHFGTLKDWTVIQYIQFLLTTQLIEQSADYSTISVTQKGRAFVSYLGAMNYKKYGI